MINGFSQVRNAARRQEAAPKQERSQINRDGEWETPCHINRDGEWEPSLHIGRNGDWVA